MSYSRGEYYIWRDEIGVTFCHNGDNIFVPDDLINVFISSLINRKEELEERIRKGNELRNT